MNFDAAANLAKYNQPTSIQPTGNWFSTNAPTTTAPSGVAGLGAWAQQQVQSSASQPTAPTTSSATGAPAGGGSLRDQVVQYAIAAGRPDIANNPDYWVGEIRDLQQRSGEPVDWGYWMNRFKTANQGANTLGGMGGGLDLSAFTGTMGHSGTGALPAGSLMTSNTATPGSFGEPSAEEAMNSPGVQFALGEAQKAIERSAASKGTLLTGGTLKALAGYETGLAGQLYGDVFNRRLQAAQFNQQAGLGNAYYGLAANTQNFNNLYNLAKLGYGAATMGTAGI